MKRITTIRSDDMAYIDKAVIALIQRGQTCTFVPFNDKIADITHPDILDHYLTLKELGLPDNTVCMVLYAQRMAGGGGFRVYPNEGAMQCSISSTTAYARYAINPIGIINRRLKYALSFAGDDYDLYCFGYWKQGVDA